eukprot:scaffold630_cov174-Amphora_coffeaeformis.AAC.31
MGLSALNNALPSNSNNTCSCTLGVNPLVSSLADTCRNNCFASGTRNRYVSWGPPCQPIARSATKDSSLELYMDSLNASRSVCRLMGIGFSSMAL